MRKKVVVNINKDYCFGCTQTTCSGTLYDFLCCCIEDKEYTKEQVPETFEELKTMCEELESQTSDITCDVLKDEIDVTIWNIDSSYKVGFAEFYYDGDKVHLFMGTGFSIPIEIPKVWAFIKSLIGEE